MKLKDNFLILFSLLLSAFSVSCMIKYEWMQFDPVGKAKALILFLLFICVCVLLSFIKKPVPALITAAVAGGVMLLLFSDCGFLFSGTGVLMVLHRNAFEKKTKGAAPVCAAAWLAVFAVPYFFKLKNAIRDHIGIAKFYAEQRTVKHCFIKVFLAASVLVFALCLLKCFIKKRKGGRLFYLLSFLNAAALAAYAVPFSGNNMAAYVFFSMFALLIFICYDNDPLISGKIKVFEVCR